jgi:hypothetical protein
MKILYYTFFSFSLLYSCKQNNNIHNDNNIKTSKEISYDQTTSTFDSIKISSIPYGSKILIDNFNRIGSDFEVKEVENDLLENEDSAFLSFYQSIFKNNTIKLGNVYKYSYKNILDFGCNYIQPFDSISTYKDYYALTKRLPDINKNKVFVFNSIEQETNNNNIINNVDLVVVNSDNVIVDNLNLSHSLRILDTRYNNEFDDYDKYFYIDKNYIIHIKYFTGWGDAVRRVFAYVKYKIGSDGSIIRFFDKENGSYKSEIEEGIIKNHMKEGIWHEALSNFQTNYCIKKYHEGKLIDDIEIVTVQDDGKKTSIFIDKNTYLPLK